MKQVKLILGGLLLAGCVHAADKPNVILIKAIDGTAIPKRNFVDLATNPTELAGDHALKSPEKKQQLSRRLDAWLNQLEEDAKILTPKGSGLD